MTQAGIHLAHKARGATSFSLVTGFKQALAAAGEDPKALPVVHGGALDPFAEGLLPLLCGPATRLFDLLHALPKGYTAEIRWGTETDTGDLLGDPVAGGDVSGLTAAALDAALARELGWREQLPPAYSNKRVDGERAHVRARRGEVVELEPAPVYLHEARFLAHDLPRWSRVQLVCRGGYYVRALARDLGRALGCRAHLGALHRSQVGPFADPGPAAVRPFLRGPAVMPWAPTRLLDDAEAQQVELGRTIPRGELLPPDWRVPAAFPDPLAPARAVHRGRLVALLAEREGLLKPVVDLRDRAGEGI